MNAIELENVGVRQGGLEIINKISAGIQRGSVTAIIGPNGAGKTTLLRAILGLVPSSGSIRFYGPTGKLLSAPPKLGYVPQRLEFDRGLPMTVRDLLTLDAQRRPLWFGATKSSLDRARAGLARVDALTLIDRPIGKLSGGEFQRVQLALALQLDPEIVLLDEPVSGVDIVGEQLFCDLLQQVQEESKLTLVMVSHDISVVSKHATHALCMNGELLAAGLVKDVLSGEVLLGTFGPHSLFGDFHGLAAHGNCGHPHHHHK